MPVTSPQPPEWGGRQPKPLLYLFDIARRLTEQDVEGNARAIPFLAEIDRSRPSLSNFLHYTKKQPSRIIGFRIQ
jgi:hypothetical protein